MAQLPHKTHEFLVPDWTEQADYWKDYRHSNGTFRTSWNKTIEVDEGGGGSQLAAPNCLAKRHAEKATAAGRRQPQSPEGNPWWHHLQPVLKQVNGPPGMSDHWINGLLLVPVTFGKGLRPYNRSNVFCKEQSCCWFSGRSCDRFALPFQTTVNQKCTVFRQEQHHSQPALKWFP